MIFEDGKAIYRQMADRLCDEILEGKYLAGDRVPGIRDYAAMLEVNANTAVKAYDQLAQDGIIYNRRGLGYFVAVDAKDRIVRERHEAFYGEQLPRLFADMDRLGIGIDSVVEAWNNKDTGK